ncbi:MAG TPA: arylesterase [Alphaproteobacteria bacterium]|nr:arylesterase [Alphaproteobacteria bacterium]
MKLLAFGDSLTAGYGLPPGEGLTAQLEKALRAEGLEVQVVNGGVSGDTTAAGLARLDWALADKPDAVMLALGANDMLRGLDPKVAEANLDAMLGKLKAKGVPVLLVGMYAARNLGQDYVTRFDRIYPSLAEKHGVPLVPFMLEGVAGDVRLNQPDGIHPNAAGVAAVVRTLVGPVRQLVEAAGRG